MRFRVNDDGCDRQIEKEDGEQPVNGLGGAELRGRPNPGSSDDEDDLRQDEIAQPELLFEGGALRDDALFLLAEGLERPRIFRHRAWRIRYEKAFGVET